MIAARIRQLSAPAQRMLGVAATIGRAFTADLIAEADDVDEMSLVHGLDELWQRGLIREHDGDAYDFSHGRIRDVAYGSLSPAARRRNHRRVAAALIVLHPDDVEAVSGQVAANLEHAGQVEEASAWYQRAAREAHRLSADSEAVRLLERARTLTGQLPGRAARLQELSVLSLLATALGGADSFTSQHQVTVQQRAVELAALLDVELDPPLLRTLVMTSLCHNDFDEAAGPPNGSRGRRNSAATKAWRWRAATCSASRRSGRAISQPLATSSARSSSASGPISAPNTSCGSVRIRRSSA